MRANNCQNEDFFQFTRLLTVFHSRVHAGRPVRAAVIIQRYILREILGTLIAVTGVLYLIYIGNRFVRFLAEAQAGGIPADAIVQLLALKSVSNLVVLLPLSVFFSVLLAFGRFYRDQEMTALAACGVGSARVARTVLVYALVCGALVAGLSLYWGPWAERFSTHLQERLQANAEVSGIAAGRFKEIRGGWAFYVESISPEGMLRNVFVQGTRRGVAMVISAREGRFEVTPQGDRYLVLRDGHRYEGEPGGGDFMVVAFEEHGVLVEERPVNLGTRASMLPTPELLASSHPKLQGELQWRWSMPIATVLLAMLAGPLSRAHPRQGRYAKLFVAILVYIIYTNMLVVARSWVERGKLDPLIGLWWVHVLFALATAYLLARDNGWRLWPGAPRP